MATICRIEQRRLAIARRLAQRRGGGVGIALYPDHGADALALLEAADIAMYQAKRTGRDRFQVFAKPPPKAAKAHRNRKAPR